MSRRCLQPVSLPQLHSGILTLSSSMAPSRWASEHCDYHHHSSRHGSVDWCQTHLGLWLSFMNTPRSLSEDVPAVLSLISNRPGPSIEGSIGSRQSFINHRLQRLQMTTGHGSLTGQFRPPQVEFVSIPGFLGVLSYHDDLPKLSSEPGHTLAHPDYLLQHGAETATAVSFARIMQEDIRVLQVPFRDTRANQDFRNTSYPLRNCIPWRVDAPGTDRSSPLSRHNGFP